MATAQPPDPDRTSGKEPRAKLPSESARAEEPGGERFVHPPDPPDGPPERVTFSDVVRAAGYRESFSLSRLGALALAAQQSRREAGVDANENVTRTSALWAALEMDESLAEALSSSGLTAEGLRQILRLPEVPSPATEEAYLHDDVVDALREHLDTKPGSGVIGTAYAVEAILESAQKWPDRGRLPGRLAKLHVDVEAALARTRELLSGGENDRTEWTSDAPAQEDFLGRKYLAEGLAIRLRRFAATGPSGVGDSYLIHLDGAWGSGKSTLFGFLEKELDADFLVVTVNAWREQHIGVQWWTLYQALRQAHITTFDSAPRRLWARAQDLWDAARSRAASVVTVLVATLAVALLGVWVAGRSLESLANISDYAVKIITFVGLLATGIAATRAFVVPDSRRGARSLEDGSANPMGEVRRLFARLLRRVGRPVVFLIDDLDRCDEDYVVGLLDVVQTLIRDAAHVERGSQIRGPYCFIAADGQWLRSSYENHYSTSRRIEVPGRPLGYLFLEKVFQLQVRLPAVSPEAKQAFYSAMLSPHRPGDGNPQEQAMAEQARKAARAATSTSDAHQVNEDAKQIKDFREQMSVRGSLAVRLSELDIEQQVQSQLLPFSRFLEPNPRSMKLFVNNVSIQQSLRAIEGVVVPTTTLALWSVVETRWPLLADHLRTHPDHVGNHAQDVPTDVRELLDSPEVIEVLTSSEWGVMTAERIRQCTGA